LPLDADRGTRFTPERRVPHFACLTSYTLRAFPNHHRALYALIRYYEIKKWRFGDPFPAPECYLQRALYFAPEDPQVYILYGIFLHQNGLYKKALEQYKTAESLHFDSAELHYDMGLVYVAMKKYSKANAQAQIAYKLGYPLPGLKQTLKRLGHWEETKSAKTP